MKDSAEDDSVEERPPAPSLPRDDRWKSMPDGDAKLAAYLEQARSRGRMTDGRNRAERS